MNKTERFSQIWTLKESYIKYLGMGLSKDLNSFSIDALNGCVFDDGRNAICHLDNFVLHGGNLLCCVQGLVFLWFYSSTGIYACIESRLLFFIAPFICTITVL